MSLSHQRITLTREYLKAFERKDLDFISNLFSARIALQDSFIGRVEGKANVITEYSKIFESHKFISLEEKRIFETEDGCGIEFAITLTNHEGKTVIVEGIDLFRFEDMTLCEIRAYIELKK